jgi:hypothetical protein
MIARNPAANTNGRSKPSFITYPFPVSVTIYVYFENEKQTTDLTDHTDKNHEQHELLFVILAFVRG